MAFVFESTWNSGNLPNTSSPVVCITRDAVDASFSSGGSFFGIILEASNAGLPPGRYGVGYSIGDGFATPDRHGYYFVGPANEYDDSGTGSARIYSARWSQDLEDAGTNLLDDFIGAQTHVPVLTTDPSVAVDNPVPTSDELTLYVSTTSTTSLVPHIQVATRLSTSGSFGALTPIHELDSAEGEYPSWISVDQCRLYVTRKVGGQYDLFMASRQQ